MTETKRETERWFDSTAVSVEQYFFFSSLALVVIFAWMEPAGAAGIGFGQGLVFWTIQISILIPLLILVQQSASRYAPRKVSRTPWTQTTLSGVVAALLFVPIAYFLDILFSIPEDEASTGIVAGLLDEASGVVVPVTVTWIALNAPWILQLDFSKRNHQTALQGSDAMGLEHSSEPVKTTRFHQELRSRASGDVDID